MGVHGMRVHGLGALAGLFFTITADIISSLCFISLFSLRPFHTYAFRLRAPGFTSRR